MAKRAKKLTAQAKKKYLDRRGSHCPYCGSGNIVGTGEREADGDWSSNEVECVDCNKTWLDIFTLSDVMETQP